MGNQLQLSFDYLLMSEEKNDYTNVYEFLTKLPIFYYGQNNPDLFELEREFIYHQTKYQVRLRRTRISKDDDMFLTSKDQDVLDTLLFLATKESTPKQIVNGRIRIKVSINQIYTQLNRKIRYEDIKKSIQRLKEAQIQIKTLDPNRPKIEWNTESIISQYLIEDERATKNIFDDDNVVHTYIEFNSSFTQELLSGKIKLLFFPKYISLKHPLSKYIYKQLVLSDMFSSNNYEKYYHNKSLFTYLLNSGYQTDTTINKNNTMRAFRQALKELKEVGLLDIDKCDLKAKKEKNKIVDYFIKLTPSQWLVDENHQQRKKKTRKNNSKKIKSI